MPSIKSHLVRYFIRRQVREQINDEDIARRRAELDKMGAQAAMPAEVAVQRVDVAGQVAEWLTPEEALEDSVILYFHGGGYSGGSCRSHRAMVSHIARAAGTRALLPEYRLAPEYPYPAAIDDCVASYRWLLDQGIAPEAIVIAGDSAGGGLVLATLMSLRDAGTRLPAGVGLISPWTDLTNAGDSMTTRCRKDPYMTQANTRAWAQQYLGDADPRSQLASPLFGDLRGLPPAFIQVGDHEILLSDALSLAEKIRAAGGEVELEVADRMWHVWHFFAGKMPESDAAVARLGGFVKSTLRPLPQSQVA